MESKKQIEQLPIYLKKIILKISEITEEKEFILYGGAPIDYLYNGNKRFNDLDIAIKKTGKKDIDGLRKVLIKKGFNIVVPLREYYVRKTKRVYLMYAKKGYLMLDICFLSDYNLALGLFNLENLYCRFPELDAVNNYDSIDGIKRKKFVPTRKLTEDNPYLLLSRFIYLCAKYQIYPMDDPVNKKILFKIKKEIEAMAYPISPDQFSSCLNSILKSIIKADDRRHLLKNLIDSDILEKTMSVLCRSLRFAIKESDGRLDKIKTKKSFIIYLFNLLEDANSKREFLELINCLRLRKWDSEYNYLFNIKL